MVCREGTWTWSCTAHVTSKQVTRFKIQTAHVVYHCQYMQSRLQLGVERKIIRAWSDVTLKEISIFHSLGTVTVTVTAAGSAELEFRKIWWLMDGQLEYWSPKSMVRWQSLNVERWPSMTVCATNIRRQKNSGLEWTYISNLNGC